GNEGQADLHHGYIDSGLTYNGNKLWKTNITGLYFALEFTSINYKEVREDDDDAEMTHSVAVNIYPATARMPQLTIVVVDTIPIEL
ncbi:hypothetical protein MJM95_28830, partial [Salmonella enterica subsp. enterica serovar Anatum]|nr:hypothetical protein [Salmonella enterica subsp. enterica serovar Anatum]